MEIVILQGAQSDLLEAYARLGDRFYESTDAALEQIRTHPESAPLYRDPFRRKLILKSAYGLFYAISGERIMVHAILDLRQAPDKIHGSTRIVADCHGHDRVEPFACPLHGLDQSFAYQRVNRSNASIQ